MELKALIAIYLITSAIAAPQDAEEVVETTTEAGVVDEEAPQVEIIEEIFEGSTKAAPKEGTCFTELIGSSGLFSTENFPQEYGSLLDCSWNITVDPGQLIKLSFHLLSIEVNNQCTWDWVKVLDSNGTLLKAMCGVLNQDLIIYSSNNTMTVQLHSDGTINYPGFLASWEAVPAEEKDEKVVEDNKQGYVLAFPQTFTTHSETQSEQLCLQMLNLKQNGKVTLSISKAQDIIAKNITNKIEVDVVASDEEVHCHQLSVPDDYDEGFAIVGVSADINGFKILSFKSVRVLKSQRVHLIQTDKFDYRPGQEVFARILLMNDELKPSKVEKVPEVWIEDPSGSRLAQWKDLALTKGLAQINYKLSDEPSLGKWLIKAKVEKEEVQAGFEVNEVLLPSFEVKIKPIKFVMKDSQGEQFQVCASYTHGSPVKGQANVTASTEYPLGTYWRAPTVSAKISKVIDLVDGCSVAAFNASEIQSLLSKSTPIKVLAEVKEFASGEKQNATESDIVVKTTPFTMDAGSSTTAHILSGLPYVGYIQVSEHDGTPKSNVTLDICARLYSSLDDMRSYVSSISYNIYSYNEEQIYQFSQKVEAIKLGEVCIQQTTDLEGRVKIAVKLPPAGIPENVTKLSIRAVAKDVSPNETTGMLQPSHAHDVFLTHSKSKTALFLQANNTDLACGSNSIKMFISGPADSSIELTHVIASGGVLMESDTEVVNLGQTSSIDSFIGDSKLLSFEEEHDESSSATVLAEHFIEIKRPFAREASGVGTFRFMAYVRDPSTGDTLTAHEDFEPRSCDAQTVSMQFSKETVRPGQPLNIKLQGPPEGLCGYSVVDKSVMLVANPNKVSHMKLKELKVAIAANKIVSDKITNEKCNDAKLLFKAYEKIGLYVLSDTLQQEVICETLIDVTNDVNPNAKEEAGYEDVPTLTDLDSEDDDAPVASFADFKAEESVQLDAIPRPVAFAAAPPPATSTTTFRRPGGAGLPEEEIVEKPTLDLRSFFPETWLFDLTDLDSDGAFTLDVNAPHTVTTWIGEAFCTSNEHGISIADPTKFLVEQDFFIDVKMPFGIKRDELLPLNVTAFNKLQQKSLPLKLRVLESGEYKLGNFEANVCLKAQDSQTEQFTIKARELHEVNVTVEAKIEDFEGCSEPAGEATGFADTVQKPIQVRPEGFPMERVQSEFQCREQSDEPATIQLEDLAIPSNDELVEGSARAWVTVTGDILAPSMNNLDKLVQMPHGCGEQNMISMVPNIYVVKYLEGTGQDKPELISKAKKFMKSGYGRQNDNYRHEDGSYSVWGPRDQTDKGSMWLTAFVVKAFGQSARYIDVDNDKLMQSIEWINKRQDKDSGCFKTEGFVVHSELAKDNDAALTASLLITFLEDRLAYPNFNEVEVVNAAFRCLEKSVDKDSDLFTKAMAAYAFSLESGEHNFRYFNKSMQSLDELIGAAKTDQAGKLYWKSGNAAPGSLDATTVTSEDVEITAFNVLTLIRHDRLPEALKAIKWLSSQRNSVGGFKSTSDTMIALQAIAEYSLKISKEDNNIGLNVTAGEAAFEFGVTEQNELLLQSEKLVVDPAQAQKVSVAINGGGCFMVQTVLRYNVKASPDQKSFELEVTQDPEGKIKVCSKYIGAREKTNMVVIEVEMLSGFVPSPKSLDSVKEAQVKKVEFEEETGIVALYFDEIPKEEKCVEMEALEKVAVKDRKPAIAKIYDYYNQADKFSVEYSIA